MTSPTVAILGAGSWGTAVALHLARSGCRVLLWAHEPKHVALMEKERCNTRYQPNEPFPPSLIPSADLAWCCQEASYVIVAVPSHIFANLLGQLPHHLTALAWLTKGIDPTTHQLLSELVRAKWGKHFPLAIISGPSFSREVAQNLPTALIIASQDEAYLKTLRDLFHHKAIRVYLTHDIVGVQLCGAVKNVLAIACGISDGLNYGANAKAALITRGLAEMQRLGQCFGADTETFSGLAGVGDLVLTCTDNQSRNRRFGLALGQGLPLIEAEQSVGQVVEGKYNAEQVCYLAQREHVDMPICESVYHVLQGKITAKDAVKQLLNRPPRNMDN